ncbi:MAG TPA: hypothetical protein VNT26_15610, partial [Candidatus Sulfotelmatobacter sp.]|nr:hypothetical protein [Candidatus Sulfotelmatobacter sp.]
GDGLHESERIRQMILRCIIPLHHDRFNAAIFPQLAPHLQHHLLSHQFLQIPQFVMGTPQLFNFK